MLNFAASISNQSKPETIKILSMKKIFTLAAAIIVAAGSMAAQTVLSTCVCPPSKQNPEGTEALGYYFKNWNTKPFDLDFKVDGEVKGMDGSYFTDAQVGDLLVFTYSANKDAVTDKVIPQIQLASKYGEDWTWIQMFSAVDLPVDATEWTYEIGSSQTVYADYKDEADDYYETAEQELAALKQAGIVVKGQIFYLKQIQLVRLATQGIEDIVAGENAPVEYFNLQGVRVANPESGLYIMRQGSKVSKIVK